MRLLVGTLLCTLVLGSSVALATPLTDFSPGKTAIDISFNPSSDTTQSNGDVKFDADKFANYGVTVGLGNNFAFQYNNANFKTKNWQDSDFERYVNGRYKIKSQEFNLLYKVNKNLTAFSGINQAKQTIVYYDHRNILESSGSYSGDTKRNWQVGLTGQAEIGKNLSAYATAATSKDFHYWKLGLGYALNKDLDLNVFYAKSKYKNLKFNSAFDRILPNITSDVEVKGFGYGLTYRFN